MFYHINVKRYRGWIFKKPLPVIVTIVTFICIFQFDLTIKTENESDLKMKEKFRMYSKNRIAGYGLQQRHGTDKSDKVLDYSVIYGVSSDKVHRDTLGKMLGDTSDKVLRDTLDKVLGDTSDKVLGDTLDKVLRHTTGKVLINSNMDSSLLWVSKHNSNNKEINKYDHYKVYNGSHTNDLLKKNSIDPVNGFDSQRNSVLNVSKSRTFQKQVYSYQESEKRNDIGHTFTIIQQRSKNSNESRINEPNDRHKLVSSMNNLDGDGHAIGPILATTKSKKRSNKKKIRDRIKIQEARKNIPQLARAREARKFKPRPFSEFAYPLYINISELYINYSKYGKVDVKTAWDYEMKFITTSNLTCNIMEDYDNKEGTIQLLFIIKSTPKHFKRRDTIRKTWVNETLVNGTNVKHIFTMGTTKYKHFQDQVDLEIRNFDDVVQMDFVDSYYNNTYKTVGAIQWVTKYCQNTKFIMFVDDDFYVALLTLIPFLRKIESNDTVDNIMKNLFLGNVIRKSKPWRNPINRWYTPPEDYPFEIYPPFCSAGSIITSFIFLKKLEFAIRYVKYFRYDDVYLGIILYKMGVELQHTDLVRMSKVSHKEEKFRQILSSHGYEKSTDLIKAFRCHTEKICGATMLEIFALLTLYILLPTLIMSVVVWYLTCCVEDSQEELKKIRYTLRELRQH